MTSLCRRGWRAALLLGCCGILVRFASAGLLQQSAGNSAVPEAANPAVIFAAGQQALHAGDLKTAESDFREVLRLDPNAMAAYTNLGVVYMRRQQWDEALEMLEHAEKLAPGVPGIRLNMGLIHYRRGDYRGAIPLFRSVVKAEEDAVQPRFLLGLCYFFAEDYAQAVDTLEPIWPVEQNDFNYLYVLGIAAGESKRSELERRALSRLIEIGGDTAAFHLLIGKAHLAKLEDSAALQELQRAEQLNPRLPFVHFNLGIYYQRHNQFEKARDEFLKDIAIEPDVAYDYDHLGRVYSDMNDDVDAEKTFIKALHRNPKLGTSWYGLAKTYEREHQYPKALEALAHAGNIDPNSASVHYLRGQVLLRMGQREQAKTEMATATQLQQKVRDDLLRKISGQQPEQPEVAGAEPK
jgi:tetratricopeptide (TPR) repeat protein